MGKENALLQVQNLKKYFKTAKGQLHAVDDITFSLERGKTLGVVGESGCGKSTLGRTILNLLPATSGEVIFDGVHVENADRRQMRKLRQEMQIIFQDPFSSLDPRLSVSEIIMEPLEIYKIGSGRQERQKRVAGGGRGLVLRVRLPLIQSLLYVMSLYLRWMFLSRLRF